MINPKISIELSYKSTGHSRQFSAVAAAVMLAFGSAWADDISWDGLGTDSDWSSLGNWSDSADPAGDNVTFNNADASGTVGTVTNVVDQNYSIGSLSYENSGTNYHTTQINSGVTLSVTDLLFNTTTESDVSQTDFTGDGSLVYSNASGTLEVGLAKKQTTTVDMSGLGSFTATADTILLGVVTDSDNRGTATLTLAETNVITASRLQAGGHRLNADLYLGQSNTLHIDEIWLGKENTGGKTTINMAFDSGLIDPSVTIRDQAGTGGADLRLGWGKFGGDGNNYYANFDLRGGAVDALFDVVQIGRGRPNSYNGPSFAAFFFDEGSVHMNTAVLGETLSSNNTGYGQGKIYVSGTGELSIGELTLGNNSGGGEHANEGGYLYLSDSSVFRATSVEAGASVGASNREINFTSGTIGNLTGTDLTIASEIKLELIGTGSHVFDIESGQVGTINADITQSGGDAGLTKTGGGTLYLAGGDDAYAGDTILWDGLLKTDTFLSGDYIFNSIVAILQIEESELTVAGAESLFGSQLLNNTGSGTLSAVDMGDYTQISIVPEPASMALLIGLMACFPVLRRRRV